MTHVHLFIPCLVDQFMPEAGEAAARVLARAGARVDCPRGQTCCGQPLYKSGHGDQARALALRFLHLFADAEAVVAPSGSCVHMVRAVYPALLADDPGAHASALALGQRTFELTEFLVRRMGVTDLGARFAGRVAYHDSCQVGRALGVRAEPLALLRAVHGLTLAEVEDADQCCGFGGPFAVQFEDVSAALLDDKLAALLAAAPTALTAAEPSCLLHLRGGLQRRGLALPALHIAQILASEAP